MEEAATARFERLRRAHFPPERNLVPAHLTLFHKLPGEARLRIEADLQVVAAASSPFAVAVTGLRSLGRGVAFTLDGEQLLSLRQQLATRFAPWLGGQDSAPFRPHVTIQNKTSPAAAAALLVELRARFVPFTVPARSLLLWHYRGGPWEPLADIPLGGRTT